MQLMWISSPAGDVQTLSITKRKIALVVGVLGLVLIFTGFLLHLAGLKIAIAVRPEIARTLGGVTTEAEQLRMESIYRDRLAAMQRTLNASNQKIAQLEQMKNRLMKIATPAVLHAKFDAKNGGQGGPLIIVARNPVSEDRALIDSLDQTLDEFGHFQNDLTRIHDEWNEQLRWVESLPTGIPITGNFQVASGFGMRFDPFTRALARHEGIDFTAETGTAILAAGDGIVTRSGWEGSYGNIVEITHADGFLTRYGHISKRHVVEGQRIKRGTHIADVGSTGRSTGPHLHFEVLYRGRPLNPHQVLPLKGS